LGSGFEENAMFVHARLRALGLRAVLGVALGCVVSASPMIGSAAADDAQTCTYASGDEAIAACTRAIDSGGFSGRGLAEKYLSRALGYQHKRDPDRAITDCSEAIRIDPTYATAYVLRGSAYVDKKDLDHAIADFNEAIRTDPKDATVYAARGG